MGDRRSRLGEEGVESSENLKWYAYLGMRSKMGKEAGGGKM